MGIAKTCIRRLRALADWLERRDGKPPYTVRFSGVVKRMKPTKYPCPDCDETECVCEPKPRVRCEHCGEVQPASGGSAHALDCPVLKKKAGTGPWVADASKLCTSDKPLFRTKLSKPACDYDKPLYRPNSYQHCAICGEPVITAMIGRTMTYRCGCTLEYAKANNGEVGMPAEDFMRFADAVRNNITGAK